MIQIDFTKARPEQVEELLQRQWLVPNGLGGYASGTISGNVSWKYHGLLVAALPSPLGRIVMLTGLTEFVCFENGNSVALGAGPQGTPAEFQFENYLPRWLYRIQGTSLEKRVFLPHGQNTVHVLYRLLEGGAGCRLELRPSMHFRPFEADPGDFDDEYELRLLGSRFEVRGHRSYPALRLNVGGVESHFVADGGTTTPVHYVRDAERGCRADGKLWSPGFFSARLRADETATLTASTEQWHMITALDPLEGLEVEAERRRRLLRIAAPALQTGLGASLVLAADQFIFTPVGRVADSVRARAAGDELCGIIAGYHWFGDWGRDTMISLEGLTMLTGRTGEARWILRAFARYIRDGLIPNFFPEGRIEALYHTADATLWFFHALDRYLELSGDSDLLTSLLPALQDIVARHQAGTRFGIGVDPADGLLRQGMAGFQLTWMDAKVGDWVVTPRRGKAVEINALWYNALRLLQHWLAGCDDSASVRIGQAADQAKLSFNRRFWNPSAGCLYDVVDGEGGGSDPAVRPNQIFAISLPHPVLDTIHWAEVLGIVEEKLLTPVGLRSLSPDDPAYRREYTGDLRSRDAAYHQGTVWTWLIGPYYDAWLKLHPDGRPEVRRCLLAFEPHLQEACLGSISEIFDAEPPYRPRGCVAQAWSVAEVLRSVAATSRPG